MLAIEFQAKARRASFWCRNPLTVHPGRLMPHVLMVPALKVCYPIVVLVPVKACDLSFQYALS
jgi:hypothetical protein